MPEFFIVDRSLACRIGAELTLHPPHYEFQHYHVAELQTIREIVDALRDLFPDGLTVHGQRYLFEPYAFPNGAISVSPMIELLAELVRRAEFPRQPSRFQSLFGCETLEAAREFRAKFGQPYHRVLRVSCERFLRADMRLLSLGACGASALSLLRKYWRGHSTENPKWEVLMVPPVRILELVEPAT